MGAQDVALHDVQEPTAQDVIDALRLVLTQDDTMQLGALCRILVEKAPPTDGTRGAGLLIDLIREGRLEASAP